MFRLYGLNETGQAVFAETLGENDRAALAELADERLQQWHAVEIWEGPMCLVRRRRASAADG